jgi:hypothetical protein
MTDTRPSQPAPPRRESATPQPDRQRLTIEYDISHVDGEAGVRLAARQAAAVHRLLAWLDDHQHPAGGT